MTMENKLRALPSVDKLLQSDAGRELIALYGREATLDALRETLAGMRTRVRMGQPATVEHVITLTGEHLRHEFAPTLRGVINATGVIIHTNLGRAPLAESAQRAMLEVAAGYSTLEYDVETGGRGSRAQHAETLLRAVTGAEAALVVNNNAAALVLLLSALAQGREVVISRGQLVEIGGGFRVPDVMAQSGARLVEVGTTNRTRLPDYERALTDATALILRAHASNFKLIGFTEETPLAEMAALAHRRGLLLVDDVGSGALLDTAAYGLDHEPTVQDGLKAGADVVSFSGDKLLGGPQAGILVGRRAVIDQIRSHPLARAVRADKLCLAALTATLAHYRRGDAVEAIPVWRMIARPLADIRATAEGWAQALGGEVIAGESTVGGGSLPGAMLPTCVLALDAHSPDQLAALLRAAPTPVIGRIAGDRVLLDPRTVLPGQEAALIETVRACLAQNAA